MKIQQLEPKRFFKNTVGNLCMIADIRPSGIVTLISSKGTKWETASEDLHHMFIKGSYSSDISEFTTKEIDDLAERVYKAYPSLSTISQRWYNAYIPATKIEEKEDPLIIEAKKRFPIGTKFRNNNLISTTTTLVTVTGDTFLKVSPNEVMINEGSTDTGFNWTVYRNGSWADIIASPIDLEAEAKKKYPIGTEFIAVNTNEVCVIKHDTFSVSSVKDTVHEVDEKGQIIFKELRSGRVSHLVYYQGEWAKILSTPKEISPQENLLEEAKKRFPIGTKFNNSNIVPGASGPIVTVTGTNFIKTSDNRIILNWDSNDSVTSWSVHRDGKWAQVIFRPEKKSIKDMLLEEARSKYPEGTRFKSVMSGNIEKAGNERSWTVDRDEFVYTNGMCVYSPKYTKWAEIVKDEPKLEQLFEIGDFVKITDKSKTVVTAPYRNKIGVITDFIGKNPVITYVHSSYTDRLATQEEFTSNIGKATHDEVKLFLESLKPVALAKYPEGTVFNNSNIIRGTLDMISGGTTVEVFDDELLLYCGLVNVPDDCSFRYTIFKNGQWADIKSLPGISSVKKDTFVEASKEPLSLLEEAKLLYPIGTKFKSLYDDKIYEVKGDHKESFDGLIIVKATDGSTRVIIEREGAGRATIIVGPKQTTIEENEDPTLEEIKKKYPPGTILKSPYDNAVYEVAGDYKTDSDGEITCIDTKKNTRTLWYKGEYKPIPVGSDKPKEERREEQMKKLFDDNVYIVLSSRSELHDAERILKQAGYRAFGKIQFEEDVNDVLIIETDGDYSLTDEVPDYDEMYLSDLEEKSGRYGSESTLSPSFKTGDIVQIAITSRWYSENSRSNPRHTNGRINQIVGQVIGVDWDNGADNSYRTEDLILISSDNASDNWIEHFDRMSAEDDLPSQKTVARPVKMDVPGDDELLLLM